MKLFDFKLSYSESGKSTITTKGVESLSEQRILLALGYPEEGLPKDYAEAVSHGCSVEWNPLFS